ncbi:MAG: purine-nucleoside phosphorylase [Clostridia bacterium]|nr:purine-nucleoside phosphorylase [Clostridia bacterium]
MENYKKIKTAADYVGGLLPGKPVIGMTLGSGLGMLADTLEDPVEIGYESIPGFPVSTVKGHEGKFVYGGLSGRKVLAMKGRFHYFEGYEMKQVVMGVLLMKLLGINDVILTNAAGGINASFSEGCLMLITDHIGFIGPSPLRGLNIEELGPRFPDMSEVYCRRHIAKAEECAAEMGMDIERGIYCYALGPQYETPAEIRAMRILGADAVGMSTVPEAVAANHAGMNVLGISCITNMAAGMVDKPLSHAEVMETTERVRGQFMEYIKRIVKKLEV